NLGDQFSKDVGEDRALQNDKLTHLMALAPLPAEEALVQGLIDSIGYPDEFNAYLEQKSGGAEAVSFDDYRATGPRPIPGPKLALIYVNGALTTASPEEAMAREIVSAEAVSDAIDDAANKPDIKAVILRVDSPGGTPLAADRIRRAVQLARTQKPVVISMGNTAASGGYWMSTTASAIVAQPGTLTGSIGVFGGKMNAAGLWNQIWLNWEAVRADGATGLWVPVRAYSGAR